MAAQEKVLKDLNVELKKVRDNMDTIAGPLEHKLDWTVDVHLAMRANCYWGLFTGPDIESFFKPYGVLRQGKYFILVEQLRTMLASSDMWDPAAKARGAHMLDQFKDMWTAYSIAYRAVKQAINTKKDLNSSKKYFRDFVASTNKLLLPETGSPHPNGT